MTQDCVLDGREKQPAKASLKELGNYEGQPQRQRDTDWKRHRCGQAADSVVRVSATSMGPWVWIPSIYIKLSGLVGSCTQHQGERGQRGKSWDSQAGQLAGSQQAPGSHPYTKQTGFKGNKRVDM